MIIPGEHSYWTAYYWTKMKEDSGRLAREAGGPGATPTMSGATVFTALFTRLRPFQGLLNRRS